MIKNLTNDELIEPYLDDLIKEYNICRKQGNSLILFSETLKRPFASLSKTYGINSFYIPFIYKDFLVQIIN